MAQGWRAELAAGARVGRQRESAVESECAVMCPHVKDFVSTSRTHASTVNLGLELTCELILLTAGRILALLTKEKMCATRCRSHVGLR